MNRRQFLTGVSALAAASALPAASAQPFVAVDLAAPGSERTALWLIESTPGGDSWVTTFFYSAGPDWQPVQFTGFLAAREIEPCDEDADRCKVTDWYRVERLEDCDDD
jgi:hypothetical protein